MSYLLSQKNTRIQEEGLDNPVSILLLVAHLEESTEQMEKVCLITREEEESVPSQCLARQIRAWRTDCSKQRRTGETCRWVSLGRFWHNEALFQVETGMTQSKIAVIRTNLSSGKAGIPFCFKCSQVSNSRDSKKTKRVRKHLRGNCAN